MNRDNVIPFPARDWTEHVRIKAPDAFAAWWMRIGSDEFVLFEIPEPLRGPDGAGLPGLTAAEADVARYVLAGLSNAEVARRRGSSPRTVANQVARIFRKLGIASRNELSALFARGTGGNPSTR